MDSKWIGKLLEGTYGVRFKQVFTPNVVRRFHSLKDADRFQYVYQVMPEIRLCPQQDKYKKNGQDALLLKEKGNVVFQKGNYSEAVRLYSMAAKKQPATTAEERQVMAVIVANRSAAYQQMGKYNLAIADIDLSFQLGYPDNMASKLYRRKGMCLQSLGLHSAAVTAFANSLITFDKLQETGKLQTDFRMEIAEAIKVSCSKDNHFHVPTPGSRDDNVPKIAEPNVFLPTVTNKIQLVRDDKGGCFLQAAAKIDPGELLRVEKPYALVMLLECKDGSCATCSKDIDSSVPCWMCSDVAFCSIICHDQASWHKYECSLTHWLMSVEAQPLSYIALRLFTQTPWEELLDLQPRLQSQFSNAGISELYDTSSYENIYYLNAMENTVYSKTDVLYKTILAVTLVRVLESVGYFPSAANKERKASSTDVVYAGKLMMRNVYLSQLRLRRKIIGMPAVGIEMPTAVGCSILPTLSFLKHSCALGTMSYERNGYSITRALCGYLPGEAITSTGDPDVLDFTFVPKVIRQPYFQSKFSRDCDCLPCKENWSTSDQNVCRMQVRCSNEKCLRPLPVWFDASKPPQPTAMNCNKCKMRTDVMKIHVQYMFERDQALRRDDSAVDEAYYTIVKFIKMTEANFCPPYDLTYYTYLHMLRELLLVHD